MYAYLLANPVNHCRPNNLKPISFAFLNLVSLPIAFAASVALSKGVKVFNKLLAKTFPCLYPKSFAILVSSTALNPVLPKPTIQLLKLFDVVNGCIKSPREAIETLSNIFKLDIVDSTPAPDLTIPSLDVPYLPK